MIYDLTGTLSVTEASKIAQRTENTIRLWLASGKLTAVKVGGAWFINETDLQKAMEANRASLR